MKIVAVVAMTVVPAIAMATPPKASSGRPIALGDTVVLSTGKGRTRWGVVHDVERTDHGAWLSITGPKGWIGTFFKSESGKPTSQRPTITLANRSRTPLSRRTLMVLQKLPDAAVGIGAGGTDRAVGELSKPLQPRTWRRLSLEELKDEDGWDEPRLRGKLIDSTVTLIVSSNGGVQRTSGQVVDTGGFFSDAPYVRLLGAKGFKDVPIEEIQAVFGMKTYHF